MVSHHAPPLSASLLTVKGLVQGIGFRPFVYRLARRTGVRGWVENRTDGVRIHAEGAPAAMDDFLRRLRLEAPKLSRIDSVHAQPVAPAGLGDFTIRNSSELQGSTTDISPDIAVCEECLADMESQPRRAGYPFVNCTMCGPRFSIVQSLPYDRARTTMARFAMCSRCREEYLELTDRRFHAQPVACNACGPSYELTAGGQTVRETARIIDSCRALISHGQILAMRGLGGFHLACDARNPEAVARLRLRKRRDAKPFAVLFAGIASVRLAAHVSQAEEELLLSPMRPVVLLRSRNSLPPPVSNGLPTVGAMLPYLPFHHLLLSGAPFDALVMTSGNYSDDPIVIDNQHAAAELSNIADALLTHNRDIHNRVDDSVAFVVNNRPRILRRARGFVPAPVPLSLDAEGILAVGAELKSCFAVGKGGQAILSQHIGDLKTPATLEFFAQTVQRFGELFRFSPRLVAHDMHPDYLSTRFAVETGVKTLAVQHHHAHIASCLAEHGLDEKVLGVSFDGTGYGMDGAVWGGEFLLCDLSGFERLNHLSYVPMPGADRAVLEPWRMGVACLREAFGNGMRGLNLPFLDAIDKQQLDLALLAMEKRINCPLTSSAGRLFDAVAAILGLCHRVSFEAEGAMRLEACADESEHDCYEAPGNPVPVGEIVRAVVADVLRGVPASAVSAKFHNSLARIVLLEAQRARRERAVGAVALSGGVFQNRYLLGQCERLLCETGFTVLSQSQIPCNDGGIALGQLAVAAKKRGMGCV